MKTRTLFLNLLTSISILLIAQGFAFADPITGCLEEDSGELYNVQIGTEPLPQCDEEDGELTWNGAPQFVLRASNGAQVGTVITVNDDSASSVAPGPPPVVSVTPRTVLIRLSLGTTPAGPVNVALTVDKNQIHFQHRVVYSDVDCTGSTSILADIAGEADFPTAFKMASVVGKNGPTGERSLYVAMGTPQPLPVSSLSVDGVCLNFPSTTTQQQVPMILIDSNLHSNTSFPPPYTLEMP